MASTLIKRMVRPDLLTLEETAAVNSAIATAPAEEHKLPITPVIAVAQEVIEGRLPSNAMLQWITTAEKVDADAIIAMVQAGTITLDWLERLLTLGERGVYTYTYIESIIGLV